MKLEVFVFLRFMLRVNFGLKARALYGLKLVGHSVFFEEANVSNIAARPNDSENARIKREKRQYIRYIATKS